MSIHFQFWSDVDEAAEKRLVAFQRWLATELQERLVWPRDEASQLSQIGQCRSFIERAVADLDRHGFLFEGEQLATLVTDQLDRIASYQKEGDVRDIYKYLETAWNRWVSKQAEELAAAAKFHGVHRSQIQDSAPISMPEIVRRNLEAAHEERRARKQFRASARALRKRPCANDTDQYLPGFES